MGGEDNAQDGRSQAEETERTGGRTRGQAQGGADEREQPEGAGEVWKT